MIALNSAWWQNLAFGFTRRTTYRSSPPEASPQEHHLRQLLAERERRIEDQDVEIRRLQSTVKVQELEIRLLVAVNERNQQRVESETAEYSHRIALTSQQPNRGG